MSLPEGSTLYTLTREMVAVATANWPVSALWRQAPNATILPSSFCEEGIAYALHHRDHLADEPEHVIVLHPATKDKILAAAMLPEQELGQFLWWWARRLRAVEVRG